MHRKKRRGHDPGDDRAAGRGEEGAETADRDLGEGTENENISTPANAQTSPSRRTEAGAATAAVVVASIRQSVAMARVGTPLRPQSVPSGSQSSIGLPSGS